MVSNESTSGQKVSFFSSSKAERGGGHTCNSHQPLHAHHLLHSTNRRAKVADAASGEGEQEVCEIADEPVSFKSGVWKHFGFPVSRHEKGEKVLSFFFF